MATRLWLIGTLCFLVIGLPVSARGSQIVVTITGTVSSGTDVTGVFGSPKTNLANQTVTLTFTFDDSKGIPGLQNCNGAPCASWDCSSAACGSWTDAGASNPGTAILQIGNGQFRFGTQRLSSIFSQARRSIPPASLDGDVFFQVNETYTGVRYSDGSYDIGGSFVQADVLPQSYPRPHGTPLTTSYQWWAPFMNSNLYSYPISFGIYRGHSGNPNPIEQANGQFSPTLIAVSGPEACNAIVFSSTSVVRTADAPATQETCLSSLNNVRVSNSFDLSKWHQIANFTDADPPVTFDAGQQIAVVSFSDAAPLPTLLFYFTAFAMPLNADGSVQPVLTNPDSPWLEPVPYSSGPVGGTPVVVQHQIVIQATFATSSQRQRWTIKIPPQPETHGNFNFYGLAVYVPN